MSKQLVARAAFAAAGVALGVAGATSPAWSDRLRTEGYYGDVDLALVAAPSGEYVAGLPAPLVIGVVNFAPAFAHGVRVTTTANHALADGTGTGCVEAVGFPVCTLPDRLDAGAFAEARVDAVLDPAARGVLTLEASVRSDNPDAPDGDEVSAFQMAISAWVDASATVACEGGGAPAGLVVDCVVGFANAGPSTALAADARVSPVGAILGAIWSCTATGGAACAQALGTGVPAWTGDLPPGGALTYRIVAILDGDPDGARHGGFTATIDASSGPQSELEPADDASADTIALDLFGDGFE